MTKWLNWELITLFNINLIGQKDLLTFLSEAESEIINIIKIIEKEKGLPEGILSEIYYQEKDKEYLDSRIAYKQADGQLRKTIMDYFDKVK